MEKIYTMKLSKVYPVLVRKAERKGRTEAEVRELIFWLMGYDAGSLQQMLVRDPDYQTFFNEAPAWNPASEQITGRICGVRVEEISDPLMKKIRCLDKLVDELAAGKPMEKIMRK
ncbi:MAG: DUF2200 domain-containing protein [Bulleidia sp.]